ncbi:hypothetical protein PHLCEN_2v42 [Hermanssonia centrifuga]|uniref:Uncharacterized protein n=1 Tax=Hermanssonia centrifuga TaxID=98765 RepID=A0A2R6S795_9APHY|nr:hypothetical protein PHLCEN_2v42 [Hermanssonia centrifuga]
MHFETIYASQDKRDDVKAGVKSTALLFGNYIREICAAFAAVFIACLAYAGILNGQGIGYFLISVLGSALHIIWQFYTLDFDDSSQCGRMFLLINAPFLSSLTLDFIQYTENFPFLEAWKDLCPQVPRHGSTT